ncbi:MAG: DUF4097 family beta strand repeat protein [Clostridia bacterium]|nr:DUF4097 family beta strand repeat protein [Clostridia bacterium]
MNKGLKIALIAAACIIVVGLVIGVVGFALGGDAFFKNEELTEREIVIEGDFSDIYIDCERSAVVILPSEDGVCRIIAAESEKSRISAEAVNGRLEIKQSKHPKWSINFFNFDFSVFKPYRLDIYLPANEYGELIASNVSGGIRVSEGFSFNNARLDTVSGGIKFHSSVRSSASFESTSGGIEASGFECELLKADCTSGGIRLSSISCAAADIECTSGGVTLTRVIASGRLEVDTVSGGITFENCDGGEIRAETVSGPIKGSLLSPKVFKTDTVSGRISVPADGEGGFCELETTSGRIEITIAE